MTPWVCFRFEALQIPAIATAPINCIGSTTTISCDGIQERSKWYVRPLVAAIFISTTRTTATNRSYFFTMITTTQRLLWLFQKVSYHLQRCFHSLTIFLVIILVLFIIMVAIMLLFVNNKVYYHDSLSWDKFYHSGTNRLIVTQSVPWRLIDYPTMNTSIRWTSAVNTSQ